jgi:hypothetical protein
LDRKAAEPLYIVKVGAGEAVDSLLRNEADWLRTLRDHPKLSGHIPEVVAHRSGLDLCFLAQRTLPGKQDFRFGEPHVAFLRRFHEYSRRTMRFEDSRLCRTLRSRLKDLSGLLPEVWSTRLHRAMRQIEQSLSGATSQFVAAHNDFTPWNIRLERGVAGVFDWEYADYEQFPLFDPLHFALQPIALNDESPAGIILAIHETLQRCEQNFEKDLCYAPETQALAYLVNLCTLYLRADPETLPLHSPLACYAQIIDHVCAV